MWVFSLVTEMSLPSLSLRQHSHLPTTLNVSYNHGSDQWGLSDAGILQVIFYAHLYHSRKRAQTSEKEILHNRIASVHSGK